MQNSKFVFPTVAPYFVKTLSSTLAIAWLLILFKPEAHAVPSYSRQTGLPCATCHFAPPELTPFGRKFKLDGYVFTTKSEVTDEKKDHNAALHLLEVFPLSVVFDTSYTATNSPQPATQNGNFQFPQDVSLFLAGAWGSHVGSFAQVTYTAPCGPAARKSLSPQLPFWCGMREAAVNVAPWLKDLATTG